MFAQAPALLLFVTEEWADGKPLERFFELALTRGDDARQRWRQFRAQRHFPFAFVDEIEKLIDDFRAAFLPVEIGWFKQRAVPFHEAVAPGNIAPARKNVITRCAIVRQKIAKSG